MPQTPKTIGSFPESATPLDSDHLLLETTPSAYKKATLAAVRTQMFGLRYDDVQALTTGQAAQALANLGITLTNDGLQIVCPDGTTRTVPFLN